MLVLKSKLRNLVESLKKDCFNDSNIGLESYSSPFDICNVLCELYTFTITVMSQNQPYLNGIHAMRGIRVMEFTNSIFKSVYVSITVISISKCARK